MAAKSFPGGELAATCSEDGAVKVWDIVTGAERASMMEHKRHAVHACSISPDTTKIVSCGSDRNLIVWEKWWKDSGDKPVRVLSGHGGDVNDCSFYQGSRHIISCSKDKTVRIWDLEPEEEGLVVSFPSCFTRVSSPLVHPRSAAPAWPSTHAARHHG
jgi:WD40 repeat protein